MKNYPLAVTSYSRRLMLVLGLCLIGLVLLFPTKSVEMQERAAAPEQTLVAGRLAYSVTVTMIGSFYTNIYTANADGTGATLIGGLYEPTWSPDGTKIAYSTGFNGGSIVVMNADGTNPVSLGAVGRNPSWSVTGKIAYEREGQIWTMNADGTNQAVFSAITQPSPVGPAWSPDGSQLAFASRSAIWIINADGSNERRIARGQTPSNAPNNTPAWSPDGTKLAFSQSTLPILGSSFTHNGIVVSNVDGTNQIRLTSVGGGYDYSPTWSPDGTKIAFGRGGTPFDNGIYVMNADGTGQVRVLSGADPAWQPVPQVPNTFSIAGRVTYAGAGLDNVVVNVNGAANAFTTTDHVGNYAFFNLPAGGAYTVSPSLPAYFFTPAQRVFNLDSDKINVDFVAAEMCPTARCHGNGKIAYNNPGALGTMNWDGSDKVIIAYGNSYSFIDLNWSPDGSQLVLANNYSFDSNYEICRVNPITGGQFTRLTNNPAADTAPAYSPDGSNIVFVSDRDGNKEIYRMNPDGTNQVRVTTDPANDFDPAYSPDGQKLIFVSERVAGGQRLFTMNPDGSNPQMLSDIAGFYRRPSYSPDGQKIIFSYSTTSAPGTPRVWTMNADGTGRAQFPVGRETPAYSPNGRKVVSSCCIGSVSAYDLGLSTANADGSGERILIPTYASTTPAWQPVRVPRRAPFDFDGDERADLSFFRPAEGVWHWLGSQTGLHSVPWGLEGDLLAPADYDGDLKTDLAVWREVGQDGVFYILNSSDNTVRVEVFGLAGDIPTPRDWDGDGKADLSVYRNGAQVGAQSSFYYRGSMANPNGNINFVPWGMADDRPVSGDYDGDGKTDAAVFRPSNGVWYVRKSSDAQVLATAFGSAADKLVPADYDGDGKIDVAVYRDGVWYLQRSTLGFTAFQYGIASDTPAPADYDGDGRADAAVFRNGVWYVLSSQTGTTQTTQFGASGDKPVPAAYVR